MKMNPRTTIALVGTTDRQLDEMLRPSGAQIIALSAGEVSTLTQPGATVPDALVLDLREQSAVPPALTAIKRQHPGVGVVIVAARLDPALMLDAMRAGVSEWVAEPVTAAALGAAIERVVLQRASKPAVAQVFAFVGAKGGVGTTTVAVNVATALAKSAPRKCLLIDFHLAHGDAALLMGVEPKFSVLDALENPHRLDDAFLRGLVAHAKSGVDLLGSAERSMSSAPDVKHVRALIDFVAQHYAYVVLDVPRSDLTILDSLDLVSKITLLANQELTTVRSASRLALSLRQRYGKERVEIVMSRYDKNAEIRREDVERVTGGTVQRLIPSDYRLALEASNKGRPVVVDNHNRLAASLVSLARGLAGLDADKRTAERQTGLFGRLGVSRS
ncbi:MAG TPA: AAA family ATPase [Vicinamibacterales bacterium]|jgi:pilus assembly protein CpaE|nr:AAA family ATPase [Vicinamibacterales bacterium]